MNKNKKGFISITIIYSFFLLFITIMLLIMFSYMNDRKMNNKIKSDLINNIRNKAPDISVSTNGSITPHPSYNVGVIILDGGNGISSVKYAWSDSPSGVPDTDLTEYNTTLSSPTENGYYYLIIKACDINSNCKTLITNSFRVGDKLLCLRAKSLHNEPCTHDEEGEYCSGYGFEKNSTLSYGSFGFPFILNLGDAYDCDVNGDGTYDPASERFYYVSDYYNTITKAYDTDKATLVYYSNVHNGVANSQYTTAYTSQDTLTPTTAVNELPTTTQWPNVSLVQSERDIISLSETFDLSKDFKYTGDVQTFTVKNTGDYKIELWGAQGGTYGVVTGGKGAYTSGIIHLTAGDILYFYVGGQPNNGTGGYNGGGNGSGNGQYFGGGGATDVRLVNGEWNDNASLISRIMVAAGGGGSYYYNATYLASGGEGGTIAGLPGKTNKATPAQGGTQIAGGTGYNNNAAYNGSFGLGGNGASSLGTGGGGGYYGGGGTYNINSSSQGGGGGSSFISGQLGCVAVASAETTDPIDGCTYPTLNDECSLHYSGLKFTNTDMFAGNEEMPTHDGLSTMIGNEGNGFAKITFMGPFSEVTVDNPYTYTNKAARLLTYHEISKCIDENGYISGENPEAKFNTKCPFLFEKTRFTQQTGAYGYFLENPYPDTNNIWVYDAQKNAAYSGVNKSVNNKYGVRPAIDVPKNRMEI